MVFILNNVISMSNQNPILEFSLPQNGLSRTALGSVVGAGVGALGRGVVNKIKGRKFTDDIGSYALMGAGVGAAGMNPYTQALGKRFYTDTRDNIRNFTDVPIGVLKMITPDKGFTKRKPGLKRSKFSRAKRRWKYVLRDANASFSKHLPNILYGTVLGVAQKYIFTSKEKLLNDLNASYEQCEDEQMKQQIAQEIEKVKNTSEDELKMKAAIKGAIWGSLISAGLLYTNYTKSAILKRQNFERNVRYRIDKKTGKRIPSEWMQNRRAIRRGLLDVSKATHGKYKPKDIAAIGSMYNSGYANYGDWSPS